MNLKKMIIYLICLIASITFAADIKMVAANLVGSELVVSWTGVEGAAEYEINVWQETLGEPTGTIDFNENFDKLDNSSGKGSKNFNSFSEYVSIGWEGEKSYAPAQSRGILQVGSRDAKGFVLTPGMIKTENKNHTFEIAACCLDSHPSCTIYQVSGEETNVVGVVDALKVNDFQIFTFPIMNIEAGDRFLLSSDNSSREYRVLVDSVRLVSDYQSGRGITNFSKRVIQNPELGSTVTIFPEDHVFEGRHSIQVTSRGGDGAVIAQSAVVEVWLMPESEGGDDVSPEIPNEQNDTFTPKFYANTTNSFSFSWRRPFDFTNCNLYVWSRQTIPGDPGEIVWFESFANAAAYETTKEVKDREIAMATDTLAGGEGWEYEKLYYSPNVGVLRIGNTTTRGWIKSPNVSVSGVSRALKIRAKRMAEKCGTSMPIDLICGVVTNSFGSVELDDEYTDYVLPIADDLLFDNVLIHSTTNKNDCRVLIDEIAIVKNRRENSSVVVTNEVRALLSDGLVIVTNMPSEKVYAQMTAENETTNLVSPILEVDLSVETRVLKTSSFITNYYFEGFGFVTNVTKETDWKNGVSVPGIYAYQNGEAIYKIGYDSKKVNKSGIFASADEEGTENSLSFRPSGDNEIVLELRILNDTAHEISAVELSYDLYDRVNAYSTEEPDVRIAHAVSSGVLIPPINWHTVDQKYIVTNVIIANTSENLETHGFSKDSHKIVLPVRIMPGGMLYYRWSVPKCTSAAMSGIGNLEIAVHPKSTGFFIILR